MGPGEPGSQVSPFKCTLSAGVALLLDRSCALPDTTPNPTFDEHGRFDHIFTAISNTCKHYTCIVSASCANRDQQAKHVQDRRVAETAQYDFRGSWSKPYVTGYQKRTGVLVYLGSWACHIFKAISKHLQTPCVMCEQKRASKAYGRQKSG